MTTHGVHAMLLIEDSDEDYEAVLWTLRRLNFEDRVARCATGDEALDFLYRRGRYAALPEPSRPSLIVLDLNLPGTDGREVLRQIKSDAALRSIPTVVYSTSSSPRDIEFCYQSGANSYLVKPVDFEHFQACWQALIRYWFSGCVQMGGGT